MAKFVRMMAWLKHVEGWEVESGKHGRSILRRFCRAVSRWRVAETVGMEWERVARRGRAVLALCIGAGRGGSRCRVGPRAPDGHLVRGGGLCERRGCGRHT